jgi:hypothetical protein
MALFIIATNCADVCDAIKSGRWKRAAGGDRRTPIGPGNQTDRVRIYLRPRFGEREDDRPPRIRRDFLNGGFRETAWTVDAPISIVGAIRCTTSARLTACPSMSCFRTLPSLFGRTQVY